MIKKVPKTSRKLCYELSSEPKRQINGYKTSSKIHWEKSGMRLNDTGEFISWFGARKETLFSDFSGTVLFGGS